MPRNQKGTIFNFFKWIAEHYIQLERKTLPYPFKLGLFENNKHFSIKNGKFLAKIEFSGQANTVEFELAQIIEQNLVEYFSPVDKKKLFSLYYNQEKLTLTDSYYCPENQSEMVILTDLFSQNKITMPVHLASENDQLIEQLSRKDVKNVAFLAATDYFKNIFKGHHR